MMVLLLELATVRIAARETTILALLTRAVAVIPPLYYFEPDDLWYTFFKGRWHQAFFWNGTWFEPKRIPAVLLDLHRQSRKPDG